MSCRAPIPSIRFKYQLILDGFKEFLARSFLGVAMFAPLTTCAVEKEWLPVGAKKPIPRLGRTKGAASDYRDFTDRGINWSTRGKPIYSGARQKLTKTGDAKYVTK